MEIGDRETKRVTCSRVLGLLRAALLSLQTQHKRPPPTFGTLAWPSAIVALHRNDSEEKVPVIVRPGGCVPYLQFLAAVKRGSRFERS